MLDSDWEAEFCRVAESHPRVKADVKNHNLSLEVPYRYGSETRRFAELTEVYQIDADFKARVDREFDAMLTRASSVSEKVHT